MGVYIRGMEMPKSCGLTVTIYSDGRVVQFLGYGEKKQLGTAIPVPDHGDLIDRDALKKECKENAKRGVGLWVDYMDISLAPAIIPADKEEKKNNE